MYILLICVYIYIYYRTPQSSTGIPFGNQAWLAEYRKRFLIIQGSLLGSPRGRRSDKETLMGYLTGYHPGTFSICSINRW